MAMVWGWIAHEGNDLLATPLCPATHEANSNAMPRYAIYFTPCPRTRLWQIGSAIVGYDSQVAQAVALPADKGIAALLTPIIQAEPHRYGFHATLRAPFELSAGHDEEQLLQVAHELAAGLSCFTVPRVEIGEMGGFLALLAPEPPAALGALAAACVHGFEPLRAELSPDDIARRMQAPLTPRQVANVQAWGYPYVFDDYVFHMTLTGKLAAEQRLIVRRALAGLLDGHLGSLEIDAISVLRQNSRDGNFRILERIPLGRQIAAD